MHENKTKYGIYRYDTENIGDEIQTLAMLRFIPQVDYIFNRDFIDETKTKAGDKIKLIANGWYMHPVDGKMHWPPKNPQIEPLLTSMFIELAKNDDYSGEVFLSEESRAYLKKYGPVGARDLGTMQFLQENGVESYFSGCLSLTLLPDPRIKKQDFILAVDITDQLREFLQKQTGRRVLRMNAIRSTNMNDAKKTMMAKYWLALYQSASCVVSSRLHAILPCLAMGTPVLTVREPDAKRFGGLIELTHHATEEELLSGKYKYNVDKPPKNPDDYKVLADKLVKQCKKFTGFDNKASFMGEIDPKDFLFDEEFVEMVAFLAEDSHWHIYLQKIKREAEEKLNQDLRNEQQRVAELGRDLEARGQDIANLQRHIEELNEEIYRLKNLGIKASAKMLKKAVSRRLSR